MKKPELLAPAGNFEKLEVAIDYGADAVYLAGKAFSLRNFSGNFSHSELGSAIQLARKNGVKTYLACNVYSRNNDQEELQQYFKKVEKLNPDALIVADPGIIYLTRKLIPHIPIHLSTQANTTNYNAMNFWAELGISRVNLARELPLSDIKEICKKSPIETETFIHGAMCISYSGRCLLSSALSGRDSNQGLCSHPCRWKYSVMEELRPGEFHSLMEDERGAYLFNSKDLCMIDHIPKLFDAGITSLKIEGRMKGISYLASVIRTYREAIDSYAANSLSYSVPKRWHNELEQVYHRPYSTGFYFNQPDEVLPNVSNHHYGRIHNFIGRIKESLPDNRIRLTIRNKVSSGDTVEIVPFSGPPMQSKVLCVSNEKGETVEHAQPNTTSLLSLELPVVPKLIVRKI